MTIAIEAVIKTISHLTSLHKELLTLCKEKTDKITNSDTEGLVSLLAKERQLVQQINRAEDERKKAVEEYCRIQQLPTENMTVTRLLESLEQSKESKFLENKVTELIEQIVQIREQEQLNRELLEQSMQFVQLNLEMLQPETRQISYGKERKPSGPARQGRSVFDSKV